MSCNHKIAARGVLGFHNALESLMFTPLYVNSGIVIEEVTQDIRGVVQDDCQLAFLGQVQNLEGW